MGGGGASNPGASSQERGLAKRAANNWNDYLSRYRPMEDEFIRRSAATPGVRAEQRGIANTPRACREPAASIREMKDFVKRYEAHWADCAWQPE